MAEIPVNGRSDSEKLHFAEQKLRCDNQYYADFARCKEVENLAFWGKWLLGASVALAIGAFIYTFTISNILAKDITVGDGAIATQMATASTDRALLRTDIETQKVRSEAIKESLARIESEVGKLVDAKNKGK